MTGSNESRIAMPLACCVAAICAAAAITHSIAADSESSPRWRPLPPMPTGVLAAAISHNDRRAIITGGIDQLGFTSGEVQLFDLTTKTWLPPLKLALGRCQHAQVQIDDTHVLIAGGQTGRVTPAGSTLKATASCEMLDLTTGKSAQIAPLPVAMEKPTAHRLPDGRAIIIGGNRAALFNPRTTQWDKAVALREARQSHASVLLDDGRVAVIGGVNVASIEVIDPKAGISQVQAAKLPDAIDDLAAVAIEKQRVWILGGQFSRGGHTTDRTRILDLSDPRKAAITEGPRLGIDAGLSDARAVAVGRHIVLLGGESERGGQDTEQRAALLLDPATLTVKRLPDMAAAHDDAVAIATPRSVIIFGGFVETKVTLPLGERGKTVKLPTAVTAVEELELAP